ncbi:MAG TPA: NAD-dependent epimerase/dehydratase family protein [Acidimicrobiales bacterium]|nr:NAD-dependent epimerase/dehydratase family protein [Acidimicrobiales bacterium]
MRVLVTGGAGFVGSHIVDMLVQAGADVVVLDNLSPAAHAGPPAYLNARADYRWIDLADAHAVAVALPGRLDAVCHQAARVGLGRGLIDVGPYVADNDVGTASLLSALARRGFRERFVLASSMVVYGEGRYRCARHGIVAAGERDPAALASGRFEPPCPRCGTALAAEAVPEDAPLDPRNVYAATKVHQEHLTRLFGRETGSPVALLRYHNVYGPRMPRDTPYAGVASIFRSALAAGRAPTVLEDGGQRRDFVHVRDVARANLLALAAPARVTGPLNVASGEVRSILDLAEALAAADGRRLSPEVTGQWRPGDVRHVFASPARAASLLGFRAQARFAAGLADLVRRDDAGLRPGPRRGARAGAP